MRMANIGRIHLLNTSEKMNSAAERVAYMAIRIAVHAAYLFKSAGLSTISSAGILLSPKAFSISSPYWNANTS